jgi:hypothetical protein
LNFRHLLERHELTKVIFVAIAEFLQIRGALLRGGTFIDATLIAASFDEEPRFHFWPHAACFPGRVSVVESKVKAIEPDINGFWENRSFHNMSTTPSQPHSAAALISSSRWSVNTHAR